MSPASDHNVAIYSIEVDGSPLNDETAKRLREVKVQSYLRLPDSCLVAIVYAKGKEGEDAPIDSHPFDIGKKLEIKLGGADDTTTTTLFKGEIVSLELNFGAGGVELLVRGYDRSHRLLRSRKSQTFQNQTSSDIVTKVVRDAGLSPDVDSTSDVHDFMQQDNETDWDFIWRLAERVGFEFVVDDQNAHFRKPVADSPIELEWPTTLRSFAPRVTASQQVSEVSIAVFDPKAKQAINTSATSPNQIAKIGVDRETIAGAFNSDAKVHVATEPVKSEAEAKTLAQALLDKLANGYIAAEGITVGDPHIKAGVAVKVTGIGTKYSGTYRVAAATHVLRGGGTYETMFANSPAHTLLGSVGGDRGGVSSFGTQMCIGLVTNNNDPDGMGRVRVKYPALGGDTEIEGTWARIASVSAGNARGMMMLPQVGEEVLVAFEHEDTTRPYVLGSLFNGKDKPGDDLLQSQDGSFALLSDQKIVATSKDEMKLTSTKELTVEGKDKVSIKAQSDYTLDGQSDVAINAQNNIKLDAKMQDISIKADIGGITIEGTQSVTIKCGAASIQLGPSGVTVSGPMISLG